MLALQYISYYMQMLARRQPHSPMTTSLSDWKLVYQNSNMVKRPLSNLHSRSSE